MYSLDNLKFRFIIISLDSANGIKGTINGLFCLVKANMSVLSEGEISFT